MKIARVKGFALLCFGQMPPKTIKSMLPITPLRNRSVGFRFHEKLLSRSLLTLWDTFAGVVKTETIGNLERRESGVSNHCRLQQVNDTMTSESRDFEYKLNQDNMS